MYSYGSQSNLGLILLGQQYQWDPILVPEHQLLALAKEHSTRLNSGPALLSMTAPRLSLALQWRQFIYTWHQQKAPPQPPIGMLFFAPTTATARQSTLKIVQYSSKPRPPSPGVRVVFTAVLVLSVINHVTTQPQLYIHVNKLPHYCHNTTVNINKHIKRPWGKHTTVKNTTLSVAIQFDSSWYQINFPRSQFNNQNLFHRLS